MEYRWVTFEDYDDVINGYKTVLDQVDAFSAAEVEFFPSRKIWQQLYDESRLTGVIMSDEGKFAGCYLFLIAPSTYNEEECIAQEVIWYIKREYQGKGLLPELMKHAEEHVRATRCTHMTLMLSPSNNASKRLVALGFKPVETRYIKRLDTCHS